MERREVKRVLSVGGGTLGTDRAEELLRLGHKVDAIRPEDLKSEMDHERLL